MSDYNSVYEYLCSVDSNFDNYTFPQKMLIYEIYGHGLTSKRRKSPKELAFIENYCKQHNLLIPKNEED